MGAINIGKQRITFQYEEEATAINFNKLLHNLVDTGVFAGGDLVVASTTEVAVSKGTFIFKETETTTKIDTGEEVTLEPSVAMPYITLDYVFAENADNYADFGTCAFKDIKKHNIILGKVEFDDSSNIIGFDYTRKTWYWWNANKSSRSGGFCRVRGYGGPDSPYSDSDTGGLVLAFCL